MNVSNYLRSTVKESDKICWLPFKQIIKETTYVILVSIFFALFLGGVYWLLQLNFSSLLTS